MFYKQSNTVINSYVWALQFNRQSYRQWSGRPGFNPRLHHTKDLIPPCLTLSNIRYGSRVKWSNPEKGVVHSPTSQCCSYWKGSLLVALDYSCQLIFNQEWNLFWYFQNLHTFLRKSYARKLPITYMKINFI